MVLPHTFFVGCFCGLSLSTNATLEATAWPVWQEKYVHTVLKAGHNTAKLFCLQSIESVTKEKVSTVQTSPGLVDFAIRLMNAVPNLPNEQMKVLREFKLQIVKKTFSG